MEYLKVDPEHKHIYGNILYIIHVKEGVLLVWYHKKEKNIDYNVKNNENKKSINLYIFI